MPAGWKTITDAKGACQLAVPEDWVAMEKSGSAVFQDATTAIAVVTSQPGQQFKPLTDSLLRIMNLPKDKVFENSAKRIFYQEKTARNDMDTSALSAMVPGRGGSCSARVVFAPGVPEETAKKIALTVGPARE